MTGHTSFDADGMRDVILMKSCEFDDVNSAKSMMGWTASGDDVLSLSGMKLKINADGPLTATRRVIGYDDGTCNVVEYVIDPGSHEKIIGLSTVSPGGERVNCHESSQIMREAVKKARKTLNKDGITAAEIDAAITGYLKILGHYSTGVVMTMGVSW